MSIWDERYDRDDYLFGVEPNAFLARQAHRLKPGARVLAVADGEGRNGVWLARQGLFVDTVDVSPVAVAKARRLAEAEGVTLAAEVADLETWTFPVETYDVVVAIFIQFAGPDLRDRLFAGMRRALKPGGLLLLEGYGLAQPSYGTGGPSRIENLYTEEMLRGAFADLTIETLLAYDGDLSEGAAHVGRSALVDLVAVKPG